MSEKSLNNRKWEVRDYCPRHAAHLASELGINPIVARILVARGLRDIHMARDFLEVSDAGGFFDPWRMKDMERAVHHLIKAIDDGKKICVYGDYDADGISATAILLRFFRMSGIDAGFYIPHRVDEGYGLNRDALKKIAQTGFDLILTVDTGATAIEEVDYARSLGLEVIITDHHQVKEQLPNALAIVNPARHDCEYPFSALSGVGVAYKLITALCEAMKIPSSRAEEFLTENLDLVALGTIADVVPLTGENRRLARAGLDILNHTSNLGLSYLIEASRITQRRISSVDVAFVLAPRINAAGRTAHASLALDLLLTDDRSEAEGLARQLNRLNDRRHRLGNGIRVQSESLIESTLLLDKQPIIVAANEGWHEGLLGLVAGNLAERYCRPVFLFNIHDGVARGSGRSYGIFSILEALDSCRDLLLGFGGHHRACGVRLYEEQIDAFRTAINQYALERIDQICSDKALDIDAVISPGELDMQLTESLGDLEPFGEGNPSPVFMMKDVFMLEPPRIVGKKHLKLLLSEGEATLSAIGFDMGVLAHDLAKCFKRRRINVAFVPIVNEWNNRTSVEMKLIDIKV